MELGGLELPISWVRCGEPVALVKGPFAAC